MLINKIGEFGLIDRIRKSIKTDASVIVGSGDDCAVLKYDKDHYQLFTCDMLVEGIDFNRDSDLFLVGRKAIAVSISDIAACGGIPRYCVVSLGLKAETTLKDADKITKGLSETARLYSLNLVGGDISRSPQLVIDVSMLGIVKKRHLTLRKGAREGDIICVSGALGGTIKGKHLTFIPRLKESCFLVENFKINSMIDISDGLMQDLGHILKASGKGAVIYEPVIPLNKEANGINDALFSGEDFELLFTLAPGEAKRLLGSRRAAFKPIGEILNKRYGLRLIKKNGKELRLKPKGYRHF